MHSSYTHFRAHWYTVPIFQLYAMRSYKQANTSIGLKHLEAWASSPFDYHTLSVWESAEHMRKFMTSGIHAKAMRLQDFLGSGFTVGWKVEECPPKRDEARRKLQEKLSALNQLSWLRKIA